MNNIVLPTAYLPCRAYFSVLSKQEEITVEIYESFQKQTSRNRAFIYTSNGIQTLSIPLASRKNHQITKDVLIDYSTRWQDIHWGAIESAYNSSPFFQFYKDEFYSLLHSKEIYLIDLNLKFTNWILKKIKTKCIISFSEEFKNSNKTDFFSAMITKQYKESADSDLSDKKYIQVFQDKHGYINNLSIIDLLFNEGPNSASLL